MLLLITGLFSNFLGYCLLIRAFYLGLVALPGTERLTDHHASQQHHQHLQQDHQQQQQIQPQGWGWVAVDDVVDGVVGDVRCAVGRHGDQLGDQYLAEPPTLC